MSPSTTALAPAHSVIILGAGRPARTETPSALTPVDADSRVMDWLLSAFGVLDDAQVHFVSGYRASELLARYPDVAFVHNPDWERTGQARSLALAPIEANDSTWVTYADVVFRPSLVERLAAVDAPVVITVDTAWRQRYGGRVRAEVRHAEKVVMDGERARRIGPRIAADDAHAEFAGLMRVRSDARPRLDALLHGGSAAADGRLTDIVQRLIDEGTDVAVVDVKGDWAELDAPQDLPHFVLGTKAESLERLAPLVRLGHVPHSVSFTHARWREEQAGLLARIAEAFSGARLIVRSSALSEDNWAGSAAGAYTSVADVDGASTDAVVDAVEEVLASYGPTNGADQVLIQEMLSDVIMSGVVMTRTPDIAAPYMVFNFDDKTSRTDTVTAGTGAIRTVFVHRGDRLTEALQPQLGSLVEVVAEIEALVGHDSLDIEFATTTDEVVHVLQVRPIAVPRREGAVDDARIASAIAAGQRTIAELQRPMPFVLGPSTQLSVMSDWNPAEIIGTKPRRLALSLYRWLVTDEVWAVQRAEYGYRDTRPCNLLVDVLGHPYVDVRATFNSFIPASLDDRLAERLVVRYLQLLSSNPDLHDKVEFDVLFTCLTFDFESRATERLGPSFSRADVAALGDALREITRAGMARVSADLARVGALERRFARIAEADVGPLERAWLYLEDLRRIGTPTFAHLARAGFVAVSLLRSLARTGVLPKDGAASFIATLETASSAIVNDARRVGAGTLGWDDFVAEYGHLRPGTYDITSPHYASAPEAFLRPIVDSHTDVAAPDARPHPWDQGVRSRIASALEAAGLDADVSRFEAFVADAIVGRERSKFIFTKNLSAALECLARFGESHGVDREQLAHIPIDRLWGLRGAPLAAVGERLASAARDGAAEFRLMQYINLPGQIFWPQDLACFEKLEATPNYVTDKVVRARTVFLTANSSPEVDVAGRIVVIPNADPGFDWLFARGIAGLVTMYGGSNSHMAIRAAEFELPATIGIGELGFEKLVAAEVVEMDCASQTIRVVR